MTQDEFRTFLERHFNADVATAMDAHLHFVAGQERIALHIDHGRLVWKPETDPPDANFYFPSLERARSILSGSEDAIGAFMAGDFFSDGYLLWTFPLLALFRPDTSRTPAPD